MLGLSAPLRKKGIPLPQVHSVKVHHETTSHVTSCRRFD